MAKPKIIYRCTACGYESAKWNGKCPSCGSWNTLEEDVPLPTQAVGNSRRKPVDLSDKIQELEEALGYLTKEDAELITLLFFEEFTVKETAQYFGCCPKTIRNRRKKVLEKLKEQLENT